MATGEYPMIIENLGLHRDWIETIARWHFE
jgi:hypothetical protein